MQAKALWPKFGLVLAVAIAGILLVNGSSDYGLKHLVANLGQGALIPYAFFLAQRPKRSKLIACVAAHVGAVVVETMVLGPEKFYAAAGSLAFLIPVGAVLWAARHEKVEQQAEEKSAHAA